MIARFEGETQRAYVERAFRSDREVATYDVLYNLRYYGGGKCSITRLAAIVCALRLEGWDIDTKNDEGATAVYRLIAAPPNGVALYTLRSGQDEASGEKTAGPDRRPAPSRAPVFGDLNLIREMRR